MNDKTIGYSETFDGNPPKYSSSRSGSYGQIATARWGDPSYIAEQYPYFPGAIWLGRNPHNPDEAIGYHDDRHVFLCAGTRTGKGRAFIINNILKWPGSIVSVDPKGENATIAAPRRGPGNKYCDGMGQDTYVLDPMRCADVPDELRAHYNLLDALDPEDGELLTKTNRIAEAICIVPETGESAEWAKRGREYISNIIAHVVTYTKNFKEKENRNLITVRKLITEGEVAGAKRVKEMLNIDMSPFDVLLDDMIDNTACKGRIASVARSLKKQAEDTPKYFESVRGEAVYQTAFLNSDGIEDTVCKTGTYPRSFDISELKNASEGISIFLCLPLDDADPYARWQRAMIAIILGEMQKKQGMPANGHQMLFSIDEFQSLGKMERTARAMNEIAGAGVKLMIGTQNLGGLQNLYKKNWETFLSGAGLQIWFGAEGPITKKHIQEELGQTEVVKIVHSINTSQSEQSTEGTTEGHTHTKSTSTSETDTENWNKGENYSESKNWNKGKNWNKSRNYNESGNWNSGINWSDSENWGQSEGKQAGKNYGPHIFWKGWTHSDNIGTNSNRSTGKTKGKGGNYSEGGAKSRGGATSSGGSETQGGSKTSGTTSSVGGSHSKTKQIGNSDSYHTSKQTGSSKGYQIGGGITESFHKKPLLEVNEINEYLASPKEVDHLAYPGMALVMISGELPFFVRKSNYDQDTEFVRCFNPNPAYGYIPLEEQPLLGYQYTEEYYLTITIPKEMREDRYFAKPIEGMSKNRRVKAGEELFEYKKEGSEWEIITISHDVKVMHIFEPDEQHETGHIMTVRFDVAVSNTEREKLYDLFWGKPLKLISDRKIAKKKIKETKERLKLILFERDHVLKGGYHGEPMLWKSKERKRIEQLHFESRTHSYTNERIEKLKEGIQFQDIIDEIENTIRDYLKGENKEEDLADIIIYYPHIPKTIVTLLKALYPDKYDSADFAPLVQKYAWVEKGQTVAIYGEIEMTAPFSGRIEMLGSHHAGRFEWPETEGTTIMKFLNHDNDGSAKEEYHYSFALRPLLTDPDYIRTRTPYNDYHVARAFDNAELNSKRFMGFIYGQPPFYTLIDNATACVKGLSSRIQVPISLRKDDEFRKQLIRYWDLINFAVARVVHVHESQDAKPKTNL